MQRALAPGAAWRVHPAPQFSRKKAANKGKKVETTEERITEKEFCVKQHTDEFNDSE
jgi:hypothetical protein